MIGLFRYLFESYDTVYDDETQCLQAFEKIRSISENLRKLIDFMYGYWNELGGHYEQLPFIFDANQKIVKFNSQYKMDDKVQSFLKELGVNGEQDSFSIDKQTLKWGAGSFNRSAKSTKIPTDLQEEISCAVVNKYINTKDKLTIDEIMLDDDNLQQYMQYKDWKLSWVEQFNTIKKQLKGWKDLVAVRYGDSNDQVAIALSDLHSRICKLKGIVHKDSLDPTDILIYKKNKSSEIVKRISCVDAVDLFIDAKNEISQLYNDQLYVGVSLKKGSSFEPRKLNFEPITGFENAHIAKTTFDPMYCFFRKDTKMIKDFRDGTLQMDWNEYRKLKTTKQLQFVIDCDDEKGIILCVRTNHDGYRQAIICEPRLKGAKAQMGKCPAPKWHKSIGLANPTYANFIDKPAKSVQYDVNDLCTKWDDIKNNLDCDCSSEDLKKLFEMFEPFEQKASDSVLWSIYNQIHFLYGLYHTQDEEFVRRILLWSEKIDENCLPYLLIMPA